VLFLAAIARRYERWEGRAGLAYCGVAAGVSVLACAASFLLRANRGLFAFVMVAVFLAASALFAAAAHTQVLIGRKAP
jgi:hypothetical protein